MTFTMTKRQKLVQELLQAKTQCYKTEFVLRLNGKEGKSLVVKEKGKELSRKIDDLIAQGMREWLDSAEALIPKVELKNTEIDASVTKINQNIKTANNVVKLVGYIDDVIKIIDAIA